MKENRKEIVKIEAADIVEQNRKFRCTKCGDVIEEKLYVLHRDIDMLQIGLWCEKCIKTIPSNCCYSSTTKEDYIQSIIERKEYRLMNEFRDTINDYMAYLHYFEGIQKTEIIEAIFDQIIRLFEGLSIHETEAEKPVTQIKQVEVKQNETTKKKKTKT